MGLISAPSAPFPHHKAQGAETTAKPHRRTTSLGGAGVRCGGMGAADNDQIRTQKIRTIFRTMKGDPMTRSEILAAADQAITVDRAATHGDAENSFGLIAAYWAAHLDANVNAHDVAVMMALFKLARVKGNPAHQDSYVDCCGYSAIAGEIGAPT